MRIAKCSHRLCNKRTKVYRCKFCKALFCKRHIHAKLAHSRYDGHTCLGYRYHLATFEHTPTTTSPEIIEKPKPQKSGDYWYKKKISNVLVWAIIFVIIAYFLSVGLKSGHIQTLLSDTKTEYRPLTEINPIKAVTKPEISVLDLELEIHNIVNEKRIQNGLAPLQFDDALANIARKHSEDMAQNNFFSHVNLKGQDPTARGEVVGYYCRKDFGSYYQEGIAENIHQDNLYTSVTYYNGVPFYDWNTQEEIAISTVEGWMNSQGHRQNILTATYNEEGIGVAISSDDKVLVTQDFC